jgi:hypothetical protein
MDYDTQALFLIVLSKMHILKASIPKVFLALQSIRWSKQLPHQKNMSPDAKKGKKIKADKEKNQQDRYSWYGAVPAIFHIPLPPLNYRNS